MEEHMLEALLNYLLGDGNLGGAGERLYFLFQVAPNLRLKVRRKEQVEACKANLQDEPVMQAHVHEALRDRHAAGTLRRVQRVGTRE
eukprot:CAMPEP_0171073392 /NCGR_PEP_ID=MMETSP0766_2-20121228/11481_1 /TAXON_ID=439317 /ORGANISM="Gambierdiscus australes, Strain CAWD 149" /LENGTH=86 /DNA_ID=CAMNT_0011530079 /DNA_START=467 /DNA_END=727 /DNA_ORIENTATION=-